MVCFDFRDPDWKAKLLVIKAELCRKDYLQIYMRCWYFFNSTHQKSKSRVRYKKNRETEIQKRKEHYRNNKAAHLDQCKNYRLRNIDKMRAYDRERPKEPRRTRSRKWYLANKDITKRRASEWAKANPQKHNAMIAVRRNILAGR